MTLYTERVEDQIDHFADAFIRENVCTAMTLWRRNDVRKFTVKAILFREIQCKKSRDILMFLQRFQCEFGWNKVKYARIMITHACFIALTLAGSLRRCLSTQPISLLFKHQPLNLANVNAWKNMCDPYIWKYYGKWNICYLNFLEFFQCCLKIENDIMI